MTLSSVLVTTPIAAQSGCATLARFGVPSPATATSNGASVLSAAAWLRQFRTYDAATSASRSVGIDLPALLTVQHSNDSVGWTRFREILDTFPIRDQSVIDQYHPSMQRLHASTAALLAECLAVPGLKVWLEHVSPREIAIAARFDGARKSDDMAIDRLIYDASILRCDSTLSTQDRVGVLSRRNRPIGPEVRRETCQRRLPDEVRIVVAARVDPVGGATLMLPSDDPIAITPVAIAPSLRSFTPPHTRGDRRFGENGPTIRAEAWLEADSSRKHLYVRIGMHAEESGRDKTTASGTSPFAADYLVYSAPDGFSIASFAAARDTMEARTDSNEPLGVQAGQGWGKRGTGVIVATKHGIVESWEVVGKTKGEQAGAGTHVRVATVPLLVKLRR